MARSALMNVMVQAVMKAGRGLARDFGEVQNLQVSLKGPSDFVTQADHQCGEVLRTELERARPNYSFLMKDAGETEGADSQHRWIIDPLNGTMNFMHGIPHFAISVALERQGQIVAGIIFNPASDELYTAEKGNGAYFNDRRLRVAGRKKLVDSIIACGVPHLGHGDHGRFLVQLRHVMGEVAGIRRNGAVALDLAYVASGRFDGFWEENLKAWDMAAGVILAREAGGYVTDLSGGANMLERGDIAAGNEAIQKALLEVVHRQVGKN
jgi:myo-inositol-1(or 4)-monophosphatase